MYAYIKNGKLLMTSDEFFEKKKGESNTTGIVYDKVIESYLDCSRVCYEGGKIIPWENSQKKLEEDARIEQAQIQVRAEFKAQLRKQIGELTIDIRAGEELGEDMSETIERLEAIKVQYGEL